MIAIEVDLLLKIVFKTKKAEFQAINDKNICGFLSLS